MSSTCTGREGGREGGRGGKGRKEKEKWLIAHPLARAPSLPLSLSLPPSLSSSYRAKRSDVTFLLKRLPPPSNAVGGKRGEGGGGGGGGGGGKGGEEGRGGRRSIDYWGGGSDRTWGGREGGGGKEGRREGGKEGRKEGGRGGSDTLRECAYKLTPAPSLPRSFLG